MSFGFGFGLPRAPLRGRPLVAAIRSLFAANEPGVWYDPSDLSTLFQDAAGTTPVTAVEQPVGLMLDKSKGLVLGPELATNGGFDADANWTKGTGWTISGGLASFAEKDPSLLSQAGILTVGRWYAVTVTATITAGSFRIYSGTTTTVPSSSAFFQNAGFFTSTQYFLSVDTTLAIRGGGLASFTIDNISVRELPGNHASQSTATSRPVLSARVNLLTKTEQFDDAVWPKAAVSVTPDVVAAPDGALTADKLVASATNANHLLNRTGAFKTVSDVLYTYTMFAKAAEYSWIRLQIQATAFPETWANFNVATGAVGLTTGNVQTIITAEANGWYRCSITARANASGNSGVQPFVLDSNRGTASPSYTGDGVSGIYIWGADLRVANDGANLPPHQRVNTATDYDTVGFPHYLRFDGVDDWLVTNTITPGTDKVQVFAGVRKQDGAVGMVVELSSNWSNFAGTFHMSADGVSTVPYDVFFASKGSNPHVVFSGNRTEPWSGVHTGLGDISGSLAAVRVNGALASQNTGSQGTGNYLAYPLYIGRRGGTTLPFNGHLYSLIVRFGSNLPAATIEKTEKYINTKTRAY